MHKTTNKTVLHARLTHFDSGRPGVVFETWKGEVRSAVLSAPTIHRHLLDANKGGFKANLEDAVSTFCGLPLDTRAEVDAGHVEFVLSTLSRDDAAWMLNHAEEVSCKLKDGVHPPSVWATAASALAGAFMISLAVFGAARLTGGLERTK